MGLRFCFDDGTELVNKLPQGGAPETVRVPAAPQAQSTLKFAAPQPVPPTQPAFVKRRLVWPWIVGGVVLLVLAVSVLSVGIRLLHLRQPLVHHLVLRLDENADSRAEVDSTVQIIRNRLKGLGISSFDVKPGQASTGEVLVDLPRLEDPERVKQIITMRGRVEFAHVMGPPSPQPFKMFPTEAAAEEARIEASDMPGYTLPYQEGADSKTQKWVLLEQTPIIAESDIRQASAVPSINSPGNYEVEFSLRLLGSDRLATWTSTHINEYIGVVVNDEVKSIAVVRSQISDKGVISGRFTQHSAEDLALVLNATGRLPQRLTFVSEKIDN